MPSCIKTTLTCSSCGEEFTARVFQSVNVGKEPELKEEVESGRIFLQTCPHCSHTQLLKYNMIYHDPEQKLLICLSDVAFNSDGMKGYTCRIVGDPGSLIEKVKIFNAGLDDVAVEICKMVTVKELEKDVNLKFFKMDGADGTLTFTYPLNGNMEMVEVGLNLYEDSMGILERNPALKEAAQGLARVDEKWLGNFFG